MNLAIVDKIARAILYEGYVLYPYRASSVKNQHRFNFGVLYPSGYVEQQRCGDASVMQTECLMEGSEQSTIEVFVRFLHLRQRQIARPTQSVDSWPCDPSIQFESVNTLDIDGRTVTSWQEAVEREVTIPSRTIRQLLEEELIHTFSFEPSQETEPLRNSEGRVVGTALRTQSLVQGTVGVKAKELRRGIYRIRIQIANRSVTKSDSLERNQALAMSLVSTHTVLLAGDGQFVSLLEPMENLRTLAAECENVGTWPVLVGKPPQRELLLSSPIILYDYPEVAPESTTSLCDSTEIDEILSLRIMTLTDAEKREMRELDPQTRQILDSIEGMPTEQLQKLHGAIRQLIPNQERVS